MRSTPNDRVESYRLSVIGARHLGPFAERFGSTVEYGNNGAFLIPTDRSAGGQKIVYFFCLVSDQGGWEHVSVSLHRGPKPVSIPLIKPYYKMVPDWEQMCQIKDLFWYPDETVVQYHPRETEYVNLHPGVLHLWRPINGGIPTPPAVFV